ncbi:MAG: bifunctional UDP-N-acetylglucosamine diphosphorylase/glucosamine-1-phosphate N-acetyltransferase GlmU [Bifidobacteriaceae bacterium]|jgi:bifunctional UDP-N-acetylglucosamine pyrophosphorylase/glucosamine-1-phosphate N-acetyltransferase|nr:bifunctional UDP-N-acetylglucosamine diphosphorylase/glucosamine-1-phosphate N-acetyltransferase GlmU [Bifidobacteriaceae bacterium]
MTNPAVIVLAAGDGKRMKSQTPKVLHQIAGRSLLGHALAAARTVEPDTVVVVVGHQAERVGAEARALCPNVVIARQDDIPGTGRAVQCALAALEAVVPERSAWPDEILVTCGDTPLLDGATLAALVEAHRAGRNSITMLTAQVDDPRGYGRIVRDGSGEVAQIVEESDATADQKQITEVNAAVYVFRPESLLRALAQVDRANAQGEMYLTDVVAAVRAHGGTVAAVTSADPAVIDGVNDRIQLAAAARKLNDRYLRQAMMAGVTVVDPATTWLDAGVELQADVTLLPGTHLAGATSVAAGAVIGPFTTLTDTEVGPEATVAQSVATSAQIGPGASVGPFSHLRPGTRIGADTKAGAFTELKAALLADGAKVPHLAYVGDASVGEGANVGAGTIFANYDGVTKSKCLIGPAVRIGSNNVIVAPVEMGAGSYSGAGTVVRGDVPPGSLAVSAGPQRVIEGWTVRKRPGTDSAIAAQAALDRAADLPNSSGSTPDAHPGNV